MHEYSLAQGLLGSLLDYLREHPVPGRVKKVHVQKGELVILSEWALKEAFSILSEGTELSGAELVIENVPVRVRCPSCGYEGDAVTSQRKDGTWPYRSFPVPNVACPLRLSPGRS
jgi:hydrogenase nickel incorporation protein HypA/HybF